MQIAEEHMGARKLHFFGLERLIEVQRGMRALGRQAEGILARVSEFREEAWERVW